MVAHMLTLGGTGCNQGCMAFLSKPKGYKEMDQYVAKQSGLSSSNDVDKYDAFEALVRAMVPKNNTEGDAVDRSSSSTDLDGEAAQVKLLDKCFGLFDEGDVAAACEHLTDDCVLHTIYGDTVEGRSEIKEWTEAESRKKAKSKIETAWVEIQPGVFKRMLNVALPKKAAHSIMQLVTLERELIKEIVMEPKFPALRAALRFARARETNDDEEAIEQMSEQVVWRAWNGFEASGKDAVRKLFAEERASETSRTGETEFEAASANDTGGCFQRVLHIERVDGTKARCKQRLYVRSELAEIDTVIVGGKDRKCYGVVPKIVEVRVLATEEMVDGKWTVAEDGRA